MPKLKLNSKNETTKKGNIKFKVLFPLNPFNIKLDNKYEKLNFYYFNLIERYARIV